MQHMFSCEEGTFYVSETVGRILAEQFQKLGVRAGEAVDITKAEGAKGNRKTIHLAGRASRHAGRGTAFGTREAVGRFIQMVEARKQAQQAQAAAQEQPKWAQALSSQTKHLVDVYGELVNYASSKHGNAIQPDDIRNMMTTVFINLSKHSGSSSSAA
jgi:hypothetical protein